VTGSEGRRRKQLLDDLEEKREYWKLKEEALYRTFLEYSTWRRLRSCRKTRHFHVLAHVFPAEIVPLTHMKPKYDIELKHINASAVNLTIFFNFLADQFENLATIFAAEV